MRRPPAEDDSFRAMVVERAERDDGRYLLFYTWPPAADASASLRLKRPMMTAMSELRWNPQLGEWVITATDRQERTFLPPRNFCPLCPTRPGGPPTEIPRTGFEIVVFENRFSALHREPPEPAVEGTVLTPVRPAAGACEVVVYTPEHDTTLADSSLEQIEHLIGVWAHRTLELGARPDVDFVYAFENRGEAVGVTLHHPHGQIYAYPYLPPLIARELASGREHAAPPMPARLWCDLLGQERDDGRRVVMTTEHWQAVVPFFGAGRTRSTSLRRVISAGCTSSIGQR